MGGADLRLHRRVRQLKLMRRRLESNRTLTRNAFCRCSTPPPGNSATESNATPRCCASQSNGAAVGTRLIDCGAGAPGGLQAGLRLAEICLAGLGCVSLAPPAALGPWPLVSIVTDHPLAACMRSQYAGWQIAAGKYFAMGSGPMRAAAGKEALFDAIGGRESPAVAVGVLEARAFPPAELQAQLAAQCRVAPDQLTLLMAPTASLAGTVQVIARSVETALHKLHELGFPLDRVRSGMGSAPLAPVAASDLAAIGRTNDAILYGGEVTLWVDARRRGH